MTELMIATIKERVKENDGIYRNGEIFRKKFYEMLEGLKDYHEEMEKIGQEEDCEDECTCGENECCSNCPRNHLRELLNELGLDDIEIDGSVIEIKIKR